MFKKRLIGNKFRLPKEVGSVFTTEDYKNLPKFSRERNGWYLEPLGLQTSLDDLRTKNSEWSKFYTFIRQEYPIQWFFRHWLTSWDNPVYSFTKLRYMKFLDIKYSTKRFIKPFFPRWRSSCKRHEYKDISSLIVDSNFALILDFWYEEVVDGNVDWQSQPDHKQFYEELKSNVKYIEKGRKKLQDKADKELTKASAKSKKGLSYQERYGRYNEVEQEIRNNDSKILEWLVGNRDFFWT